MTTHEIRIETRYGPTTRDCSCTVTRGLSHSEDDFPSVLDNGCYELGGKPEVPLDIPMRQGESIDDYFHRLTLADGWVVGYGSGLSGDRDAKNPYL